MDLADDTGLGESSGGGNRGGGWWDDCWQVGNTSPDRLSTPFTSLHCSFLFVSSVCLPPLRPTGLLRRAMEENRAQPPPPGCYHTHTCCLHTFLSWFNSCLVYVSCSHSSCLTNISSLISGCLHIIVGILNCLFLWCVPIHNFISYYYSTTRISPLSLGLFVSRLVCWLVCYQQDYVQTTEQMEGWDMGEVYWCRSG